MELIKKYLSNKVIDLRNNREHWTTVTIDSNRDCHRLRKLLQESNVVIYLD